MRLTSKALIGIAALGSLAGFATSASADIACSGDVCWHVHEHYTYPSDAHVVVHPDNWTVEKRYTIREHEGPGYWRGDTWVDIH